MNKNQNRSDELLDKFESKKRALVKPFFYERLENKLRKKHSQEYQIPALRIQLAMLLLLVGVNILSLVFLRMSKVTPLEQDVAAVIELYDLRTQTEDSE